MNFSQKDNFKILSSAPLISLFIFHTPTSVLTIGCMLQNWPSPTLCKIGSTDFVEMSKSKKGVFLWQVLFACWKVHATCWHARDSHTKMTLKWAYNNDPL